MKLLRVVALAIFAACISIQPVLADTGPTPAIAPCVLTTTSVTVCQTIGTGQQGVFYGTVINSLSAYSGTVTCWANGTGSASGTVLLYLLTFNSIWPAGGKLYKSTGASCQASASPPTGGIELYFGIQ
jgi:hypothetical protein